MVYQLALDSSAVRAAGLRPGDDQGVLFLRGNPRVSRVDWGHPGPLRAERSLDAWMDRWSSVDPSLKACLQQAIRQNRDWLTDPAAPWLGAPGSRWNDWLDNQNISVRSRLEASCGPLPRVE